MRRLRTVPARRAQPRAARQGTLGHSAGVALGRSRAFAENSFRRETEEEHGVYVLVDMACGGPA